MSKKQDKFVLFFTDGSAETLDSTKIGGWEDVLQYVLLISQSAGSQTPLPASLYRNGTLVAENIRTTAWHWSQKRQEEERKKQAAVAAAFPAPWDDAP